MRIALASLLLAISVGVWASQAPQQANVKKAGRQKSQATEPEKNAKAESEPAKPMHVLVEGEITTKRSEHKTAWEREEEKEKSAYERSIRNIMIGSLSIASIMLVVALAQVGLFVWQLGMMRRTLRDTEKAANAALTQAASIKSSERARVFVKVNLERIDVTNTSHGQIPHVRINAKNLGKTVATVTGIRGHIFAGDSVPTILPPERNGKHPILDGLAVGPTREYTFQPQYELDTFKVSDEYKIDLVWYCAGTFSYKDIFGDSSMTGFCWECRPREGGGFRFCVDSPLNYQT